jgi:two-component system OmpR family response regulator
MKKPRKILVIDDSAVMLARIKRALVAEGYEVIATTQLVGNARHLPTCDLVLIDYHMPGLNGSSVLDSLRSVATTMKSKQPFYVYTSDSMIALKSRELGFDGAFSNKGDDEELVRQVRAYFRILDMREAREAT